MMILTWKKVDKLIRQSEEVIEHANAVIRVDGKVIKMNEELVEEIRRLMGVIAEMQAKISYLERRYEDDLR